MKEILLDAIGVASLISDTLNENRFVGNNNPNGIRELATNLVSKLLEIERRMDEEKFYDAIKGDGET